MKLISLKILGRPLLQIFIIGAVINAFLWIYSFIYYTQATDLVPLHYTIYFGIDLIDFRSRLFMYPLFGTIVIICNTSLALLMKKERLARYLLVVTNALVHLYIVLTVIFLINNYY